MTEMDFSTFSPHSSELAAYNHTELYQTCRRVGLNVLPTDTREDLIRYLEGVAEPPSNRVHDVDRWRDAIMKFVLDYPEIHSQLSCPARTLNPKACFTCLDTQVLTCLVNNSENETLIQLRRK